jgi:nucleoid DNA-binding protein
MRPIFASHSRSTPFQGRDVCRMARRVYLLPGPCAVRPFLQPEPKDFDLTRIVKGDLIDHIAAAMPGITRKDATAALDLILTRICDEVGAGNEVAIKGFGTFEARRRAERMGRNPRTGEAVLIAASTTMGFRAAKARG